MAITEAAMRTIMEEANTKKAAVEPKHFRGHSSENASTWLERFNAYSTLRGLEGEKKVLTFGLFMYDAAALWYQGVDEDTKKLWTEVEKAFKKTYVDSNWVNSEKLENIKLSSFKNCEEYVTKIQLLGSSCGIKNEALIPYLTRGLPSQMRSRVVAHRPPTVQDCISRIYLEETLTAAEAPDVKAVETDKQLNSLADTISDLNKKIQQLQSNRGGYRGGFHRGHRGGGYRNNQNRGGVVCYNCNKQGHFKSECWSNPNHSRGGYGRGGYNNNNSRGNRGGGYPNRGRGNYHSNTDHTNNNNKEDSSKN